MARARILLVSLLALVVAVGLAFIAKGFAAPKPAAAAPRAAPRATIQVLIAAHNLSVGDRLDATMIAWRAWPADGIDPAYVTAGVEQIAAASAAAKLAAAAGDAAAATKAAVTGDPGPAGAVLGEVVRAPIFRGEPIVARKLVQSGTSGVMAVTLETGMRAMSIPVATESAAGGFIQPGDHVDVVLVRKLDPATTGQSVEATTVMRNVRVMAIDQTLKASDKLPATPTAATSTLEVTPDQAQALVLAHAQGELTLVLRSYADGSGPPTRGFDQASALIVHVFRNGAATDVRVAR